MNKLQKLVAAYLKEQSKLSKKASEEILRQVSVETDPDKVKKIVESAFKKYDIIPKEKLLLEDFTIKAISIGAGKEISGEKRVNAVRKWLLNKAYSPDGSKFSSSINDLDRISEITSQVRQSLKAGQSWRKLAQDLSDKKIQVADVAKDVQSLADAARKAYRLSDDSAGYQAYLKQVNRVQRRISGMVDQDTSKLKRAYQDIVDLTNKSTKAQIDNAIKYASYYKERYNAERIARTEMAGAYGDAFTSDNLQDEDSIGVRWVLSSAHPEYDICNVHAEADLYGMGPGGYPKDHFPPYPAHPNCLCGLEQIIEREEKPATAKDYDPKKMEKYLSSLPESKRREILGVSGADSFEKNKATWSRNMKSWEGHEKKTAIVPANILKSK